MPLIKFVCDECDRQTEELFQFREKRTASKCICGAKKRPRQDFRIGPNRVGGDKERISMALGVHISQIESGEAERVHPGATYDHNQNMIIKNLTEKKQRMKERGYVDRDEGKGWY